VSTSPLCKKTKSGGRERHRRKEKHISDPEEQEGGPRRGSTVSHAYVRVSE
jgi:hypothetical protein